MGANVVEIYSKIIIRYTEIIKDQKTSTNERLSALKTLKVISATDSIFKKVALESFGTFMISAVIMHLFKSSSFKNESDLVSTELETTAAACLADLCTVQSIYFKSLLNSIFLYFLQ